MFSLLENALASNDERLLELQGKRLDRVDSGSELKIGDFTASISWFVESSSIRECLPVDKGDPPSD